MEFTALRIVFSKHVSARKVVRALGICLGLLLLCVPVFAQLNYGHIYGGITDQTGGSMAGAMVTVIDVDRGNSRPLITDGSGEYNAPDLLPGTYTIRVEATGFQTTERQNVVVQVGQDVRVDVTMQPGAQTQTITVTEAIPMINTTNATLGSDIQTNMLVDLPVNGHYYLKLLDFHPGILETPGGGSPNWSSNGTRQMAQMWMLDGVDNNDNYAAVGPIIGGSQSFNEVTILPTDSIQEVNIQENPKAEFGWREGAQVNVGLKSGTNSIHGTAYAFGRNNDLDAKNAFLLPSQAKAEDNLEQFGASIGGPIKKDKLFYFGNYEGQRFTVGSPEVINVPSSVSGTGPTGSFPDAIADIIKRTGGTAALSPLSLNLAGCNTTQVGTISAANGGLPTGAQIAAACSATAGVFTNGLTGTSVDTAYNNVGGSNNAIAKFDYHLNDHNALNWEYIFGQGHFYTANSTLVQPYWESLYNARTQVVRGVWVWTPNSSWVNEARFGYDRYNLVNAPAECTSNIGQPDYQTAYGFISGATAPSPACGFPSLTISGGGGPSFTALGGALGGSGGGGEIVLMPTWSGIDELSYTRGKHLFKFGAEFHDSSLSGWGNPTNATGTLGFGAIPNPVLGATPSGLEDFLSGYPATGAVLVGNAIRNIRAERFGLFAQDDYRIAARVTLNIGLRYEYQTPITEANNLLGNFNPNATNGDALLQVGDGLKTPYTTDKKNFAPRIGVAWDVTGKGTTVVRLGGGVVYNTLIPFGALISVRGADLAQIPTGATLIGPAGNVISGPTGTINDAVITEANGPNLPWAVNTPIFNATPSAEKCGNGETAVAPGTGTNPATCSLMGITPYLPTAWVGTWTLGIQHAFTNSLSLELSYVGNHGGDLSNLFDVNQPTTGPKTTIGTSASPTLNEQNRRPYYAEFPYLSTIKIYEDAAISNYNAVQAALTQRVSHGLSLTAGYTFDHALDEQSSEFNFSTMNSTAIGQDYGRSSNAAPQQFTFTVSYLLPGRKSPGQMLEGWQVNSTVVDLVGLPVNAVDTVDDFSGTGENEDRWTMAGSASSFDSIIGGNLTVPCYGIAGSTFASAKNSQTGAAACTTVATGTVSNPTEFMPAACIAAAAAEPVSTTTTGSSGLASMATTGCYVANGAVIVPPAQGTYGTMRRDALSRPPFHNWDFSVSKGWKFKERYSAQFRAEFFNIMNQTLRSSPSVSLSSPGTFGTALTTPNGANPIVGNGGPRLIQLGLKLIF